MKKVLLACLALIYSQGLSQTVGKPSMQASFYKVTDGHTTLYLLGSIHLAPKSLYPLPKEIEDAFAASTRLAVETDISEDDKKDSKSDSSATADSAPKIKGATYPDGDTLWKHLDKPTADRIKHVIENMPREEGDPPANKVIEGFDQIKPWFIALLLVFSKLQDTGFEAGSGIDLHFLNEAKNKGEQVAELTPKTDKGATKPVASIETVQSQFDVLAQLGNAPEDQQIAGLKSALDVCEQPNSAENPIKQMFEDWLSKDEVAITQYFVTHPVSEDENINNKFLKDRNMVMANFIENDLKAKTQAFVVVGVAHLVGDTGIVNLLRKRGYSVTMEPITWTHKVFPDAK